MAISIALCSLFRYLRRSTHPTNPIEDPAPIHRPPLFSATQTSISRTHGGLPASSIHGQSICTLSANDRSGYVGLVLQRRVLGLGLLERCDDVVGWDVGKREEGCSVAYEGDRIDALREFWSKEHLLVINHLEETGS